MSDEKRNSNLPNDKKPPPEVRVPPRTWIIWIAILALTVLLWNLRDRADAKQRELTYKEFIQLVEADQITKGVIRYSPQSPDLREITGRYETTGPGAERSEVLFRVKTRLFEDVEKELLASGKFEQVEPPTLLLGLLYTLLPFLLLGEVEAMVHPVEHQAKAARQLVETPVQQVHEPPALVLIRPPELALNSLDLVPVNRVAERAFRAFEVLEGPEALLSDDERCHLSLPQGEQRPR